MNAARFGCPNGGVPQLMRTTDYARQLVRRAQLALAALAVPVSIAVGAAVAGTVPPDPAVPAPALRTASDLLSRIALLPAVPGTVGALARAEAAARDLAPDRRTVNGMLAGLSTLTCCWTVLAAAGAIWRRRLHERDMGEWAEGWALVEPHWSGRTV
jgi:hypothetical protein